MRTVVKKSNGFTAQLKQLIPGDLFIKDFHDVDSILAKTYQNNWSLYCVLPDNSKYLDHRPVANGGVYVYNLTKNSIHCISGDTGVVNVDAEVVVIKKV